jgi:hypothetical protein
VRGEFATMGGPARGVVTTPADHLTQPLGKETAMPEFDSSLEYRDLTPLGFPGYAVGSDGTVWTCKAKGGNDRSPGKRGPWRPMKRHLMKGYYRVNLDRDGKTYSRLVHRLVLEAFVGPRPAGMEARHFPDQAKTNCCLDNLSWDTHTENMRDKKRKGVGSGQV